MRAVISILIGFAIAFLIATGAVWLHNFLFPLPSDEAFGGMAAFGDFVLFSGVFCLVSIIPSIALFRLVRGWQSFWPVWTAFALFLAFTGAAAGLMYLAPNLAGENQFPVLYAFAPLRILGCAPLVLVFAISGSLAPVRTNRKILYGCAAAEGTIFIAAVLHVVSSYV